jgi:hypothetical protein
LISWPASWVLRPGSVSGADLALRSLAAFLAEQAPEVCFIADIHRCHVEDFRTWLTRRSGYRTARFVCFAMHGAYRRTTVIHTETAQPSDCV